QTPHRGGRDPDMPDHPTVKLRPPNPDPRVEINAGIAGLIQECWRLGLQTRYCCQGDHRCEAYIMFTSPWPAILFTGAAAPAAWSARAHGRRDPEVPPAERAFADWLYPYNWVRPAKESVTRVTLLTSNGTWRGACCPAAVRDGGPRSPSRAATSSMPCCTS